MIAGYTFKPVWIGAMPIISDNPPPDGKLLKALAVITSIHDEFDATGEMAFPGKSKESCILCALTVRDFLQRIGFKDAVVRPTGVMIRARRDEHELHSVGVGLPERFYAPEHRAAYRNGSGWPGHLVTTVGRWAIDTTLAPWKREHWPQLPELLTLPYVEPTHHTFPMNGLYPISATWLDQPDDKAYEAEIIYLDQPKNRSWKIAPDAGKDRRRAVTDALVKRFGPWRG